jgi:hypothetical protein
MWEDLDTDADDIFARAQLQWTIKERADLLFGAEYDGFLYDGDHEHAATVGVDDAAGGFPPFRDSATMALDPWLEWRATEPSPDRMGWAPARVTNAGAGWMAERWAAALTLHWQGSTARRASDVGVQTLPLQVVALDLDQFRARELASCRQETRRVVVSLRFDA